ncbi:hypothetical protein C5167_009511 [Papaver somniferum]|uniref:Cytochrome b561 and DOMON domain-containing protein n=1 Tax=Papaver somniferum TaxID=3469 RepID=A0A4Y7K1K6_PAPSO|nr:cytochrome b561 and DOMON domain-containing protein At5g47530-like [Papaver somniferum]RZC65819.1 hypothetical protein C5167_009511 [Papaver somniferum]
MVDSLRPVLFLTLFVSLFISISAQTCRTHVFPSNNQVSTDFTSCSDLPHLNSFIHWKYDSATRRVNIAYRHTNIDSSRWIAWAINPTRTGMEGCQALVAYQKDGRMTVYTSPIPTYSTTLAQGNLSFPVPDLTATFQDREMTIFATIQLPTNTTTAVVNQVWQEGPLRNGNPSAHDFAPANKQSMSTLDFLSGQQSSSGGVDSRTKRRNVHGVLNAVAWGILMPVGAIAARYLRVFNSMDPAWFYIHIATQTSAYIIGVAGWATGLKLGSESSGIQHNAHRNIGIALFILGTLQVFALLLRPKPDHKYRSYWNIYHRLTGCIVIVLSIINIFKGFDILEPEKKWKNVFIGVLIGLAVIVVLLEAFTWYIVLKRKKSEKSHHGANGHAGGNGNPYGA